MPATIIDGREVATRIRSEVAREVEAITSRGERAPGLATILVGDDPASAIYVANKRKTCAEVGISDLHRHLPAESSEDEVAGLIEQLNADPEVSGILLQLPHRFFVQEGAKLGITLPPEGAYGVGMVFMPSDSQDRARCERAFEKIVRDEGQHFLGWIYAVRLNDCRDAWRHLRRREATRADLAHLARVDGSEEALDTTQSPVKEML